jgi:predicted nucleic acid-binding protein
MYLDTSVVAKLYFYEPESQRISELLAEDKSEFCSSELLISEFHSVACRKLREKFITPRQFREAIDKFMEHDKKGNWHLYPVTRETLSSAGKLIEKLSGSVGLKTLDAIHLATCIEYSIYPIFTTDKVMLSAAKELKIEIAGKF